MLRQESPIIRILPDLGPGLWFKDYNTTWAQDEDGEEDTGEIWTFQYNH